MKKIYFILFLFFSVLVHGGTIKGGIAHDCAQLQKAYDNQNDPFLNQYQQAVLGFLSGLNVAFDTDKGIDIDGDTIFQVVINHCKDNPIKFIGAAVDFVYENVL